MTNSRRRIPTYRIHKPTGLAVVTLNGKDHYLGPHGTPESRAKYERILAEYLQAGRRTPTPPDASRTTVGKICERFLSYARETYRDSAGAPSGEADNVRLALEDITLLFLDLPISEFGPMRLKLYRDRLIARGLARTTINQRVNIVRRAFRWGVEMELVPPTILHGLQAVEGLKAGRTIAHEMTPVQAVPLEDIERTLPELSESIAAMVRVQLLTGARPGEIVIMRPCDIDLTSRVWCYRPSRHKNTWRNQLRAIQLGPQSQEILKPFLQRSFPTSYLFNPREVTQEPRANRHNPNWSKAGRYTTQSYGRAIVRACGRAGVPKWTPGRLRHNAAEEAHRRFGLEAAAAHLGHRRVETTQIYSNNSALTAIQIAEQMG
jgi:integrase